MMKDNKSKPVHNSEEIELQIESLREKLESTRKEINLLQEKEQKIVGLINKLTQGE